MPTQKPYTFAIRTSQPHKAKIAKEYGLPNAQPSDRKKGYAYNKGFARERVKCFV